MKALALSIAIRLAVFAVVCALASCAGLTLTASTPWGDVSSKDGLTTVTARPIVIPQK
jgi:hypothetical protein